MRFASGHREAHPHHTRSLYPPTPTTLARSSRFIHTRWLHTPTPTILAHPPTPTTLARFIPHSLSPPPHSHHTPPPHSLDLQTLSIQTLSPPPHLHHNPPPHSLASSRTFCRQQSLGEGSPRKALRGGIQKSIFKHISGNRGTSRPKVDKSAPMAPRTHLRCPHEGPSVDRSRRKRQRDWCLIAEQPAPAPHLARIEGRAALTHMCETVAESCAGIIPCH